MAFEYLELVTVPRRHIPSYSPIKRPLRSARPSSTHASYTRTNRFVWGLLRVISFHSTRMRASSVVGLLPLACVESAAAMYGSRSNSAQNSRGRGSYPWTVYGCLPLVKVNRTTSPWNKRNGDSSGRGYGCCCCCCKTLSREIFVCFLDRDVTIGFKVGYE